MIIKKNLNLYRKNIFSQNGEDGVIAELLKRLNMNDFLEVCEFGASDGVWFSNTFNLIQNKRVKLAVYIEQNLEDFQKLNDLAKKYDVILPINKKISFDENDKNSLDNILSETNLKKQFDILSIDIDSYDLDVWRSVKKYKPKIIIIECGRQKYGVKSEHSKDGNQNSFSSTFEVFKNDYELVFFSGNCFFIDKSFFKDKIRLHKNFILDDHKHFLLNNVYYNFENHSFLKRALLKYFSPFFLKPIIGIYKLIFSKN